MEVITRIISQQREFFLNGKTQSYDFRIQQLKKLKQIVRYYEDEILNALYLDLNKTDFEAFATELGIFYKELNYTIHHLRRWMRPKKKLTPMLYQPAKSSVYEEAYGVVLIIAPWNYPFLLALQPLIGAIAAGNCVVIKPSEYAPATAKIIEKIILDCFCSEYVQAILGDRKISKQLTYEKFDYIFFTGSTHVAYHVMEAASKNLTPVTLELGGKSPCIIDHTANLKLAARRIAWGKFTNAGQTCIAPDYILIEKHVKKEFMHLLKKETKKMYGEHPCNNVDYPKIINQKHFERLKKLMKNEDIYYGGTINKLRSKIEPTIINQPSNTSPIMQEEIFGPILPIIEYTSLKKLVHVLNNRPKPLACYIFSTNKKNTEKLIQNLHFGGGTVNDTMIHIGNHHLPFGGIGKSGMGLYHGKASFHTFSHKKSILKKANYLDLSFRYPPYTMPKKILRYLMR